MTSFVAIPSNPLLPFLSVLLYLGCLPLPLPRMDEDGAPKSHSKSSYFPR